MQLIYNKFKTEYDPTIGVEFASKQITMNNGIIIKIQIWDTVNLSGIPSKFINICHSLDKSPLDQ